MYAGIGPRVTPMAVQSVMTFIGTELYKMGFILRSGDGIGADQAWAEEVPAEGTEIFVVNPTPHCPHAQVPVWTQEQWDFANKHFGMHRKGASGKELNLMTQSDYVQGLFCRNLNVLMGEDLNTPVDFVAYWFDRDCPNGWAGGTGHTISMANELGIPRFNINFAHEQTAMEAFIANLIKESQNA